MIILTAAAAIITIAILIAIFLLIDEQRRLDEYVDEINRQTELQSRSLVACKRFDLYLVQ